ncbi:endo-1,4-beta-xylanase [Pseudobacteroides cellulosolvens]|uniref:Beta-xylanase n=1 Tax=Pseudobacteroides cellulosolvens ATCC 35603 = DSM 2933 TaxID=398512 RepID=A0A0L6JPT6_9FIRM|nr:endo-1,4-beta-xylanase [Pseudobacteroides cellulosolvens]KNY27793.1 Endo-1,4-beta-xylanase [Pseudobacteroides cellulosolvens ATCC 35603 = DSM 2933]
MKKRVLSLLLSVLMVVQFLPSSLSSADALTTSVYSMASDNEIQGKAVGDTLEGTTWLQKAGSPTLTIVDNGSGKGISVTGRTQDWHCTDLKNLTTLPDGFDYTITVTGHTYAGAKMKLAQTASPYGTHVSQDVVGDGAFSLEKTFTYAQLQADKTIRIQSEGTTGDFTIDSILITKTAVSGVVTPTPTPSSDGATIDDINITFNNADNALWSKAFGVSKTTNAAVQWVSDFGNGDTYALKGTHLAASSDYVGANNAIQLTFDKPLAKNAIYTVSYSVYVPAAGNEGKETLVGPGIVLSGDYAGAAGVTKFPTSPGTIDIGTWKEVNVTTPASGLNDTLKSIDFRFVVNDAKKHPDVWYIDNISIKQELISVENIEPDFKEYPALKDVYKDYFMIGTTSSNSKMTGNKLDIIKYHFNAFTPENEMKPSSVQNVKGTFTYDALDQQLDKVPGLNLIGHTLAWHSQSPGWMWGTPDALPVDEAKANMDAHIESVLGRYGAGLYSIDVVNEAFADDKNNADWKLNLRDNDGWYKALGWEWVEDAFLKAAKIVDANKWNCKLYYNDYNLDYADKATSVYNMVKDINERYAGKRPNGKPLIEGIGMQAHYNQNTNPANVEKSINLFSTLPGVAISVTELDISYSNSGNLTDQQTLNQAGKYAQLFDIYKKNAAGPANRGKGRIERVTFWGTNDGDSWRAASFPLLFDKNLCAKEAFKAVLDPAKYLSNAILPTGQTYEKYPALKDVYKDYFTMGIFGSGEINALVHNFAAYAPGNEMKPDSTQKEKGIFTYNNTDEAFNNLRKNNPEMLFYGHTLAWHSQSPTWMWDAPPAKFGQPGTFDRATALANLNDHIENVLGNFGGRLEGIDVVNEAVGTADPKDWKASLAKGEGWYKALGWEWVELAFLKAAKVVDSHPEWDCKLIYNDFGLDSSNKAHVVYEMVKDINERYKGVRPNGKSLIEVIGMQAHYNLTTNASDVENSIKLFATLPGVKVNITEMDIGCPPGSTITTENENNQAMKFAELFRIYKKYSAGPANKTNNPKVINRVSICGVRDAISGWRAGEFALLFDSKGYAKQALVAVLDPEAFLATHDYIEKDKEPELEPVDGIYVYDMGKGDPWTGANIILGNDASKWPWSTTDTDGKVAFTPEKDVKYRLTFNYTAKGTTAIRVRWIKDNSNGSYTDADGAVVNDHKYSADQVATTIPAYFNSGMVNMGSYTLTTEIKLDGSQSANGLIGNIAIRGGGGNSAYSINWIKVEKIGTDSEADKLLVSWPKVTKHKITVTAGTGGSITPSGEIELASGASQTFRIEANSNYLIADVLVDGVSVGAVSTYTFNGVTKDHTISAAFKYVSTSSGYTPTSSGYVPTSSEKAQPVIDNPIKDVPAANTTTSPIKDTVVATPKEALDKAEKAFKQNPGIVKASNPITLGALPKTNKGLTPVTIPIPAGTKFTAIVSPNADGSFTSVPTYTDKSGTVYVLVNEAKTLIPVTINTVYKDVPENHWSSEFVRTASKLGIVFGNGDSTFKPDATVTNQQTVTMLMRTVGFNAEYNKVLSTAAAKGIKSASGLNNNGFTSRAVTAVLIKDILAALNVNVSLTEEEKARILAPFKDLKGLTKDETLSIAVAVKYGILVGTSVGKDYSTMRPEMSLTRAQMATISIRLVNFITKLSN